MIVPLVLAHCALLCTALQSLQAHGASSPTDAVIARAGNVFVSEREFVERYEMLPGFGRHVASAVEARKTELLYSMIAEKLLAQDAEERHLDRDSVYRLAMLETRKLLARDALYKQEVIAKAAVSAAELRRGMHDALLRLTVRYLFFPAEDDARFVRNRMTHFEDFAALAVDTSYHALRDTATVVWGEADPAIEAAAYRLHEREISPVVQAGSGWYILTLASVLRNFDNASLPADRLRERVLDVLRRRKEKARLEEFAPQVLRGKRGYASGAALRRFGRAFEQAYAAPGGDSIIYLTPQRAAAIDSMLDGSLGDTLAVAGDRVWTAGDVLAMLTREGFGVHRTALRSIPARLSSELMGLVQRELMGEEALRRGLDTTADVRGQVAMWSSSFLSALDREAIAGGTAVSDAEIWATLRWEDSTVAVPQVRIRSLRTATYEQMESALEELSGGKSMDAVVRAWSADSEERSSGGLSEWFPVTARPPLGELASRLRAGERCGPFAYGGSPYFFELVGRKSAPLERDTSFARRYAAARKETLERKIRRAVTLRLAAMAHDLGVDIYSDRLKMIPVTRIPMMTFRILGFGGRMLAVPFVVPELDWLGEQGGKETIVP
ncbi:MAG TPA: peptidylprolyl isomerase [Bacteroidota bacterium]|nr:peptidylprolyl isomerase [Bacteroidota bacterium]